MPDTIFDINGVLDVQSKYLNDLAVTSNADVNTTTAIDTLQSYLNTLNTTITNSGASTAKILTQQDDVKKIVDNEENRLNIKKEQIDNKLFMSKRMAQLNDNYKNRQSYINTTFFIVAIGLLIFIVLIKMRNLLTFIPGSIFDILITILFAVIIIIVIFRIYNMRKRDNLNFDELKLPGVTKTNTHEERRAKIKSGDLLGISPGDMCVGQDCCVDGSTTWSDVKKKCYPKIIPADSTISPATPEKIWDISTSTPEYISTNNCIPANGKQRCDNICIGNTESCSQGFSCMSNQTPSFTPTEFSQYSLYK